MKIYLQNIVESINNEQLPADWLEFDTGTFSNNKTLYDFQREALENAIKSLWLYYADKGNNKESVFQIYKDYGLTEIENNLKYGGRRESKAVKILSDYFPQVDGQISFEHFINRMCFWMATGSGKTLVIVKLIEILSKLIKSNAVPKKEILFLTYRQDLIEQFKKHVDEFNRYNTETKINLRSLKEYDTVKNDNKLGFFGNEVTVFYYRSDLISDERSEKYVDYRDYGEDGNWYLILDEAHKGDKDESKRQAYYLIMSRNGFMFNFSATFTDIRDFVTCVYEINLASFIEKGYGKHIYVSQEKLDALRNNEDDFSEIDKQKIFLKSLILMTYINKQFRNIRNVDSKLYHKPLLMTLVNSVNTENSDLKLVFGEIEKIGKGKLDTNIFQEVKDELKSEYGNGDKKYEFEDLTIKIDEAEIDAVSEKDILESVFNSETKGMMEVLKIPGNEQELIFKLKTSDKPFMLSKTGDIYKLLREHFHNYEINESFDNESEFRQLNEDDSEINMLMGSRAFYEGWDSNRPNIIMFVNIGMGSDSKKFVLQSVGRGVRIEPFHHERKRIQSGYLNDKRAEIIRMIQRNIPPVETLFIYGTKAENLKEILRTLREEKKQVEIGSEFIINKETEGKLLLIPVCKESDELLIDKKDLKYPISNDDYNITKKYWDYIGEKIALMKYEAETCILERASEGFNTEKNEYFQFGSDRSLGKPEITLKRVFDFISLKNKDVEGFKKLDEEIIHFKRVKIDEDKKDEVVKKIKQVLEYSHKQKAIYIAKQEYETKKDLDAYTGIIQDIEDRYKPESNYKNLTFKHLLNHYYLPVVLSDEEKVNYITHIIKVKSEVSFMKDLNNYIKDNNGIFKDYDWWMFSKIDETTDSISIPYYNPSANKILNYHPDFIFWLRKGGEYKILFVDPKGTAYTSYEHKVDGYSMLFEGKTFKLTGEFKDIESLEVRLLLRPKDLNTTSDKYKKFWFHNIDELEVNMTLSPSLS